MTHADDAGPGSAPTAPRDPTTTVFFALWAVATLLHQVSYLRIAADPLELALTLAAFAALAAPRRATFVLLLAVQIVEAAATAPRLSNHAWLVAFAAATMLATLALARSDDDATWRRRFTAPLRALLVGLYFWAVVHKLNRDFFDPDVSCAAALYESARAGYASFLPSGGGLARLAAAVTLVVEAAIPALLLAARTRRAGVLLGAAFHLAIGLVPYRHYFNFSAVLFALFFLQTAEGWVERARDGLSARARASLAHPALRATCLLALAAWLLGYATDAPGRREVWDAGTRVLWLAYAGGAWLLYARFGRATALPDARRGARTPRAVWALPIVFASLGATTYLGLRTEGALAMFSNLRTERGESNHLLFPSLDVTGWTSDVVVVHESSDEWLAEMARRDYGHVFFELRERLARRPDTSVTFTRAGVTEHVPRVGDDPRFTVPAPRWLRAWVSFRPVDLRPHQRCLH